MKTTILFFVLLLSLPSFGTVKFLPDTEVSPELQVLINEAMDRQCVAVKEMNWQVRELSTEWVVDNIDNGLTDVHITTHIEVDAKEYDSNHSRKMAVTVRSLVTHANNGIHRGVNSVEGCQ